MGQSASENISLMEIQLKDQGATLKYVSHMIKVLLDRTRVVEVNTDFALLRIIVR